MTVHPNSLGLLNHCFNESWASGRTCLGGGFRRSPSLSISRSKRIADSALRTLWASNMNPVAIPQWQRGSYV